MAKWPNGSPEARPWKICQASSQIPESSGRTDHGRWVYCTRFNGHEEKAKSRPEQHYDELRKFGWYDAPDPA